MKNIVEGIIPDAIEDFLVNDICQTVSSIKQNPYSRGTSAVQGFY